MNAERYSAMLDEEALLYEARHLAHALFCMFASNSDGDILSEAEVEAGKHFAWQLVQHTTRLCREFELPTKRGQR